MAAIDQGAPSVSRSQKSITMRIPRALPAGALAWSRVPMPPRAPAGFSANPDQIALGRALAARVSEATLKTAAAVAAAGLVELASSRFAKPIHDVHNLTTRAIARFLVTGQGTTETERNFIGRLGVLAATHRLSVATLIRSYLLWRNSNLRVLNEEVKRLGTAPAVAEQARMIIRSIADTGILRVAHSYDDRMRVAGPLQEPATVAPNGSNGSNGSKPHLHIEVALRQSDQEPPAGPRLSHRPAS